MRVQAYKSDDDEDIILDIGGKDIESVIEEAQEEDDDATELTIADAHDAFAGLPDVDRPSVVRVNGRDRGEFLSTTCDKGKRKQNNNIVSMLYAYTCSPSFARTFGRLG